ncbi:aldehyde dehydrogenase family protein, partial [Enterococcus faecium]|uniref:aldehyde dehydrogenase family protein n=1 Tax=Enterococcus faecium TaxID=1352 RepID=UPI0010C0627C
AAEAKLAVNAAVAASERWKKTPVSARAAILNRAADRLEAQADQIAREMTREMGKALNLAKDEVLRAAQTLRFYAVEAWKR